MVCNAPAASHAEGQGPKAGGGAAAATPPASLSAVGRGCVAELLGLVDGPHTGSWDLLNLAQLGFPLLFQVWLGSERSRQCGHAGTGIEPDGDRSQSAMARVRIEHL